MSFDPSGRIEARIQASYGIIRPRPYFEEQDPDLVRNTVYRAIRELLASGKPDPLSIAGLSFSSQMYGVFPVDKTGRATGNNILWSDGRAEAQTERWKVELGPLGFYPETGCPLNSIYPIAKLAWMREREPERFAAAERFVSIKDYVTAPLSGHWACDYSMASSTGLLDIRRHEWHADALKAAGVEASRLPSLVSGLERFSLVEGSPLAGTGLPVGLPIFLGGGDGPLANLGSGASSVGAVNIDLGTSGAARALSDAAITDAQGSCWCFCLTKYLWAYGGIVTNAGNAYQWLGSQVLGPAGLSESEAYDLLNRLAAEAGPGAEGLLFLPYLRKARSPYWDGRLKGTIYGLTADHGTGHIARSLLEAVAFDLRTILILIAANIRTVPHIVFTGGMARSPLMPQLLADILEREIRTPENSEGSVAGAALMGFHGLGLLSSLEFNGGSRRYTSYIPNGAVLPNYRKAYAQYAALVQSLRCIDIDNREGARV